MTQPRIVLVNPRPAEWNEWWRTRTTPPIGIMSIAAVLRSRGYETEIVDFATLRSEEEGAALDRMVNNPDCTIIGFSIMTVQTRHCVELLKIVKAARPEVKSILGGIHAALHAEETCSHPLVDYVCTGAGEYTMLELVDHLCQKLPSTPNDIKGLVWKENGEVRVNPSRPLHHLDDLPFMAYDLIDVDRYIWRNTHILDASRMGRRLELHTGQGCPFRCAFCINGLPEFHNRQYRGKSGERILDEIEYLLKTYQVDHISFADELFFVNWIRIRIILDGIRERGLTFTWSTNVRADFFNEEHINPSRARELEECGCIALLIGAESGSQRMLDFMKKEIMIRDVLNAAETLAGTGIVGGFSFMYGVPGETKEEMKSTFRLIGTLFDINPNIFIFGPAVFRPYPGSILYRMCVERGYWQPKSLEDWGKHTVVTGYHDLDSMKWVDEPKTLPYLGFYGKLAFVVFPPSMGRLRSVVQSLLRPVARWRFERDFFSIPLEYWLFTHGRPTIERLLSPGGERTQPRRDSTAL